MIEKATRYNQGTHRAEGIGTIPSMTQQPIVSKPIALNQSVHKLMPVTCLASQPTQHSQLVNVVQHEHRTAPAVPTSKNTPYRSSNLLRPPVVTGDRSATHNNVVCYECGQTGHIKPNCPKLKGSVRVAAICTEDALDESGNMEAEQKVPDEYQGEELDDEYHPVTTQSVEESTNEWVEEPSQYNWDDSDQKSNSGGTTTY